MAQADAAFDPAQGADTVFVKQRSNKSELIALLEARGLLGYAREQYPAR